MHRRFLCYALLAFAAALVCTEWTAARVTPAAKCAAARYRLIGKLVRAEMACDAVAVAGKRPVDASCATRAEAKFASAWGRTEASGACVAATAAPIAAELQRVRAELRARLHPVATPSRCVAGKLDRAARYAVARLACDGRAAKKGLPPTHGTVLGCLATARARLGSAFQRLESRSDCQTIGDSAAVGETLDGFVVCVGVAVAGNDAGTCGATTTTTTTSSSTTAGPATTLPVTTSTGGVTTSTSTSTSSPPSTTTTTTSTTTTTGGGGTTSTTSTTTTTTTLLPCGGIYPLCVGSCPEGQECTGDALADTCACATTTTTTSTASTTTSSTLLGCGGLYPVCLGSCPDGETCTAGGLAEPCSCAPVTTTTTPVSTTTSTTLLGCGGLYPACLGSCPDGETCSGGGLLDPCTCMPIATTTTAAPTTTTTSTTTTITTTTTTTTATASTTTSTTLLPCGGLYPACLGSCPDGEACSGENLLDPCTCTPITTTTTAPSTTTTTTTSTTSSTLLPCGGVAPACLGSCPPGQSCSGPLLGACSCQ